MSKTTERQEPKSFGSWSDSGEEDDEKVKDETCLVAQASSEVCSESSYFSDENSSIDDLVLDNEYDKLKVEESLNVTFYETPPPSKEHHLGVNDDLDEKKQSGTKWVFRIKLDEHGIVSRNKARLVAQGYNQQEGINYDETYASVARLESIRILLAYACALDFKLFQLDVKSAFPECFINEEVYWHHLHDLMTLRKPDHDYKTKESIYGLKQAPKAWYD
ncbi:retrovirus-related pol polyprotein from transposon TNT 1-94 [Tanacetum coccineum]